MPQNKKIGNYGESIALKYLANNNYSILEKNYRTRLGEIDVIAMERNYITFIEVKTRRSCRYGYPREAVDANKQERIRNIASYYLLTNKKTNCSVRFDVVEIILMGNGEIQSINLIKNAF